MTPEMPDAAETAKFLRRFADLMSNGQNAIYLQNAAVLLETLTARLTAASEEEELWRYKYETAIQQADAFEAECDALKHDVEGHVNITSAILSERDALKSALQAQEEEISELHATWDRERGELTTKLEAQDKAEAEICAAFDRERENFAAKSKAHLSELSELRLAFDQERAELQGRQKVLGDELATIRSEYDALKIKIAALEKKRAEARSFDQIGNQQNQTVEHGKTGHSIAAGPGLDAGSGTLLAQRIDADPAAEEINAVVPKTTLRQVRAQFEYLAKEFVALGDIASQVMCELGVYTMDLALNADRKDRSFPGY